VQPISVVFTIPEDTLPSVRTRLRAGASLEVRALDRTQKMELGVGRLSTKRQRHRHHHRHGQAGAHLRQCRREPVSQSVRKRALLVDTVKDATVVPVAAIQRGQPGTFVHLVKADDTVEIRPVELGKSDGEKVQMSRASRLTIRLLSTALTGCATAPRSGAAGASLRTTSGHRWR